MYTQGVEARVKVRGRNFLKNMYFTGEEGKNIVKKKVIIYGLGSGYEKRKDLIKSKYEIIAFTDSKATAFMKEEIPVISQNEINCFEYDMVLICSIKYFSTINYLLMKKHGVPSNKIIGVSDIEKDRNNEAEAIVFSHIEKYNKMNQRKEFEICEEEMWLICENYFDSAGALAEHYFAQDIWAAKKILNNKAVRHYDVGSRLEGFISHLLVFCEEVFYFDIRPLPFYIPNLIFVQGDATDLKSIADNSIESLSSLHALEHFGLGRYSDSIDPEACFKAMSELQRVLKHGGRLYIGVPIGPQNHVVFNAHRIFNPLTIIDTFNELELLDFSYVKDYETVKIEPSKIINTIDSIPDYSCGLFEFTKK